MRARTAALRSYSQAVSWLDSLQGSGIRPGLDRIRLLLHAAGSPHRTYETVIVAGTNGKGSTAATLASILQESGCQVGLYTSPHLVSLRERWRLNGRDANEQEILEAARTLRTASKSCGVVPTYFEALTVLAFILFCQSGREIVVLEVGLGGRLDATNVTKPLVALITSISVDHREFLGDTVRGVAREKAGVIHRGTHAVTSVRDRTALDVIVRRARDVGAPLSTVADDCRVDRTRSSSRGVSFDLQTPFNGYHLKSPLLGRHQIANVMLAVRGAEELASRFPSVDAGAIERGVSATRWRGRLEHFDLGATRVWVDGGHNEGAAQELVPFVRRAIRRPRVLVFGMMRDKDFAATARLLFPLFDHIVLSLVDEVRGCEPRMLAELAREAGVTYTIRRSPAGAVKEALKRGGNILVCGSLYLAGAAIPVLDRKVLASDTIRPRRTKS